MSKNFIVIFFLCFLLSANAHSKTIYSKHSNYAHIQVTDQENTRCLSFNNSRAVVKHYQTCINLGNIAKHELHYTKFATAALFFQPNPKRILIIGLGGGVIQTTLSNLAPDAFIETAEIDPEVFRVANEFFYYRDTPLRKTYIADGLLFARRASELDLKYDMIVLDAFNGEYIPESLMTQEFLKSINNILSDDGVVIANTFSASRLYNHESATYASVFGEFRHIKVEKGNRIIFASKAGLPRHTVESIQAGAAQHALLLSSVYNINVNEILPRITDATDWDKSARVLTEQWSPANLLQHKKNDGLSLSSLFFLCLVILLFLSIIFYFYKIQSRSTGET